jgi:hypothetical protein
MGPDKLRLRPETQKPGLMALMITPEEGERRLLNARVKKMLRANRRRKGMSEMFRVGRLSYL